MYKKIITTGLGVAFATMTASAVLIAEYDSGVAAAAGASGAANPTNGTGVAAWTVNLAGAISGYNGGYDTGNGGWNSVDGTSSGRLTYQHAFDAAAQAELAAGWIATYTFALNHDAVNGVGPSGVDDYYTEARQTAQVFYIDVAGRRNLLSFTQDASGNVLVNGSTVDTGGGVLLGLSEQIGTGSPSMEFVTLTLGWTQATGLSTLTDNFGNSYAMSSSANAGNTISWGSGSTGGQGSVVANNVTLNSIPEPATLGMVAAFGGAILFIRRKMMM